MYLVFRIFHCECAHGVSSEISLTPEYEQLEPGKPCLLNIWQNLKKSTHFS